MSKKFTSNYDNVNWKSPKGPSKNDLMKFNDDPFLLTPLAPTISDQILEEKGNALRRACHSIDLVIPYLYELKGLLAYFTKCPAKDRRDLFSTIEEIYAQIDCSSSDIKNSLNIIKKP